MEALIRGKMKKRGMAVLLSSRFGWQNPILGGMSHMETNRCSQPLLPEKVEGVSSTKNEGSKWFFRFLGWGTVTDNAFGKLGRCGLAGDYGDVNWWGFAAPFGSWNVGRLHRNSQAGNLVAAGDEPKKKKKFPGEIGKVKDAGVLAITNSCWLGATRDVGGDVVVASVVMSLPAAKLGFSCDGDIAAMTSYNGKSSGTFFDQILKFKNCALKGDKEYHVTTTPMVRHLNEIILGVDPMWFLNLINVNNLILQNKILAFWNKNIGIEAWFDTHLSLDNHVIIPGL